jgi:hypothetical protein
MASVYREAAIAAPPEDVWAALADFGAVHERLAPGFVTACAVEAGSGARTVTFANGAVAREVLVGSDADHRRLAYTVVEGPLGAEHHNASAQVLAEPGGTSRFVWVTDVLPDHLAGTVGQMMDHGLAVMVETLTRPRGR